MNGNTGNSFSTIERHVVQHGQWRSSSDLSAVEKKILEVMEREGLKGLDIGGADDKRVEFRRGSLIFARFWGGWFVKARQLPVRGVVSLRDDDGEVHVDAEVWDRAGWGYFDRHLRDRYTRTLNDLLVAFSDVCR